MMGLPPGTMTTSSGVTFTRRGLTDVLSDGLAQLRQARRRSVVRKAFVKGVTSRVDNVARGIEIGLSDLEMDDVAALCLERSRLHQYFEGGLGAETRHSFGEAQFALYHHTRLVIAAALLPATAKT